jgi:hypothetical protein
MARREVVPKKFKGRFGSLTHIEAKDIESIIGLKEWVQGLIHKLDFP